MGLDPATARRTYRTVEPIHAMIYFTPRAAEEYAAIGIEDRRMGYFASRSAAMGRVGAGVVAATFFNFEPGRVARAIPAAWDLASPADLVAARLRAADRALRELGGELVAGAAVEEAAGLARRAAERAAEHPEGRPLFAAQAGLPWPDEPHLVLWHAESLLREYRGDGHVALLTTAGFDPLEALVSYAATGAFPAEMLRVTRAWSEEEWAAGADRLRSRGWLTAGDEPTLTEAGAAARQAVEDRTDELAAPAYEGLGEEGCERLRALARPLSRAIVDSGVMMGLTMDVEGG